MNGNVKFTNCASRIWLPDKLVINQKNENVTICQHDIITKFFAVIMFLLSSLVTGTAFMAISS